MEIFSNIIEYYKTIIENIKMFEMGLEMVHSTFGYLNLAKVVSDCHAPLR